MSKELQDWEKAFVEMQGEQKPELTEAPKEELPEPEKEPEKVEAAEPEKAEAAPAETPKDEPKDDEPFPGFKSLPKEAQDEFTRLRDEREAARQAEAKAIANYRAQQGQLAPAQRRAAELERQIDELRKSAPAPKAEKFDKWSQDFQEESEAIKQGLDLHLNPLREELANTKKELEEIRQERARIAVERERQRVYASHADADELLYQKDANGQPTLNERFTGWLSRQNPHKVEMWKSYKADDIIDLLHDYKRDLQLETRAAPVPQAPTTPGAKKILRDLAPTLRPMQSDPRNEPANLKEWERDYLSLQAGSQT